MGKKKRDGKAGSSLKKTQKTKSPFDVPGIKTKATTQDILDAISDVRARKIMDSTTASRNPVFEQALVNIVRSLPDERVVQILDYARYIQLKSNENDDFPENDETEAEIDADEKRWDARFASSQDGLTKMADKVRAEIQAGRTKRMVFTKDGKVAPK